MKSCPSCQQVYPDDGPDYCTNDGTPLVRSTSDYGGGAATGGQWQAPPPPGYGYNPGGSYPPPGGYPPPYGYAPAPSGGEGIATAALWTGIGAVASFLIIIMIVATSRPSRDAVGFVGLLAILSLLSGLTALILGIVSLSMANRNPRVSKAKAIVGLILGTLPLLLWLIGLTRVMR